MGWTSTSGQTVSEEPAQPPADPHSPRHRLMSRHAANSGRLPGAVDVRFAREEDADRGSERRGIDNTSGHL